MIVVGHEVPDKLRRSYTSCAAPQSHHRQGQEADPVRVVWSPGLAQHVSPVMAIRPVNPHCTFRLVHSKHQDSKPYSA